MSTAELKTSLHSMINNVNDSSILEAIYTLLSKTKSNSFIDDMQNDFTESYKEIKLHVEGKIELQSARDFINEL